MLGSNLKKLTVIAYLLTLITGVAVILPFVVKSNASELLHASLAYTGYVFSFFMLGMLIIQYLNGFIIKYIRLKTEIYAVCAIYFICLVMMRFTDTMPALIPIVIILGMVFGATTTIPNYVIVHAFDKEQRSSRLNRLDLFFSIGSFCFPFMAGYLLQADWTWWDLYALVIALWALIIILTSITTFPNLEHDTASGKKISYSKWRISTYFIALAVICYFISYVGFTYWLQPYLLKIHVPVSAATWSVTLFWLFYGIGCYLSSFVVKKIAVQKYVVLSMVVVCIAYFAIYLNMSVFSIYILSAILGLGCSTVYSSSISYGSLLLERPSPRLVSFFIACSGVGTFVGQFYSSYVEDQFGFPTLIAISALFMLIAIVLYLCVMLSKKMVTPTIVTGTRPSQTGQKA